jgi:hypothetical protein
MSFSLNKVTFTVVRTWTYLFLEGASDEAEHYKEPEV